MINTNKWVTEEKRAYPVSKERGKPTSVLLVQHNTETGGQHTIGFEDTQTIDNALRMIENIFEIYTQPFWLNKRAYTDISYSMATD